MAAPLVRPGCALAAFPSSLGVPGAADLRTSCGITETKFALTVAGLLFVIFSAFKFPKWGKLLPLWISGGYALIYVPLNVMYENASELAYSSSGLSKMDWINIVTADGRTRFSVMASIFAAFVVSLNAWVTRWEQRNR